MCKDKNGEMLAEERDILNRWQEYFKELYNVDRATVTAAVPYAHGNESDLPGPTLEEVKEAIDNMKNYKSPGEDGITAELLKNCGEQVLEVLHQLIVQVWVNEDLPTAWRTGVIVPLHKKGDKLSCENYRGITLLSVGYKVFSSILNKRIKIDAENMLGEYQGGFRPNRSTADQTVLLKLNLEKCYERNAVVHILFIDFKQAFDSICRGIIEEALRELGVHPKLARPVMATLKESMGKVLVQNKLSNAFEIDSGVKQGDCLSTTVFNLVLHYAINATVSTGNLFNRTILTIAYADDVAILSRSLNRLKGVFLEMQAKEVSGSEVPALASSFASQLP